MSARSRENIPVTRAPRARTNHGKALPPPTDSSEEELSPHSSIFEAPLASDAESETSKSPAAAKDSGFVIAEDREVGACETGEFTPGQGLSIRGHNVLRARGGGGGDVDNERSVARSSPGLETIIEQKSCNTLRDGDSTFEQQSSDELSEDDEDDAVLLPTDRRKKSHTQSTRSDYFYSENENQVYDYASPGQPLYQPVSAFNGADSPLSPSSSPFSGTPISASLLNRNYASSSPLRTSLQGPAFRPPVSGYRSYGTLTNHPFHHAPLARGDGGEGSGGGGRSGRFPGTGASTPNSIRSRMGRSRSGSIVDASGGGPMNKWKPWQVCGFFCCLGRREDE